MGKVRHFRVSEQVRHDVNVARHQQLLDHCVKLRRPEAVVI